MLESKTISISINRNWKEVYEAVWRPEAFAKWASGLSKSSPTKDGETWTVAGPEGSIRILFTAHNDYGVMDHYVDVGNGANIYVPLRIIQNGDGAEVLLTLFRQQGMSDAKFAADAAWVECDLHALKALVTQ